ncbi:MAG: hypothetical protein JOY66_22810 [Acetobacteraceae bacterium]|nr:hypothetical protein [Acetobacteraceae bacterium]
MTNQFNLRRNATSLLAATVLFFGLGVATASAQAVGGNSQGPASRAQKSDGEQLGSYGWYRQNSAQNPGKKGGFAPQKSDSEQLGTYGWDRQNGTQR